MSPADDLLRRLLEHFYSNGCGQTFVWSYQEDTTLDDVDPDLARDLDAWLGVQKNPTNGT